MNQKQPRSSALPLRMSKNFDINLYSSIVLSSNFCLLTPDSCLLPIRQILRLGNQMFRLMIRNGTPDNLVQRFPNHERVAVEKCNERVGTTLHIPNQFGIEHNFVLIEFG